ncbi:MAG: hypothetical protein QGH45_07460 [Myxococcota bacterium]|nr:hypothetical protein [Myxococcota bacterium]
MHSAGSIHLLEDIPLTWDERALLRTLRIPGLALVSEIEESTLRTDIRGAIEIGVPLARAEATVRWVDLRPGVAPAAASRMFVGDSASRWLEGCERATLMVVTIGAALVNQVRALSDDEVTNAYHLDSVGSVLVEAAAIAVDKDVGNAIRRAGYEPTARRSPGYGDWPLTVQPLILQWCGAERIGVRCTDDHYLEPSKSITAVIGWRPRRQGTP